MKISEQIGIFVTELSLLMLIDPIAVLVEMVDIEVSLELL